MTLPMDNFFIRRSTVLGCTIVTIIMGITALMFQWQAEAGRISNEWVVHTYQTIGHIQSFSSRLKDAELGERGYLVTGNEDYLAPYKSAQKDASRNLVLPPNRFLKAGFNNRVEPNNLPPDLASPDQFFSIKEELAILRWLTADNPAQQRNLGEMNEVLEELLANWTAAIHLRETEGAEALRQETTTHHGKELMDTIRMLTRVTTAEEARLLDIRLQLDAESGYRSIIFVHGTVALFYAGLMLAVWLATRHWRRARIAEAEVYAKAHQIDAANRELKDSNRKLLDYTEELQKSEEELKVQQEELEVSNEEMEEKTKALEEQNAQIRQQSRELNEAKRVIEEKVQALERSGRYKSEFLANMSHELRTPLNSLLILAKSFAVNEEGNLTAEQIEEAKVIHSGGIELLGLINDILDLSKVEAGKIVLQPEHVAARDILQKMQQQFMPIAKQGNVAFHVKTEGDMPVMLYTDAQRAEQILKNLLSNAFKFTESGSVTLTFSKPASTTPQRASLIGTDTVIFSVTDTGIGIESSKLKDIFEAFQQENGSIDRHYGGTGLGLTIARKFAHILGGEIHVESKKGEGSTFTLLIPVTMPEEQAETPGSRQVSVPAEKMPAVPVVQSISSDGMETLTREKSLLIIEDDSHFTAVLTKMARRHGYQCLTAGDGRTGLLMAAQQNISAIILDLTLPDIDGVHVLDQLKNDLKTRHIPVHIISGRDEEDNVVPLKKGAIGYLLKPVDKEAIDGVFNRIKALLASELKKVLVVEDDRNTQRAMETLLRKKDIEITFCGKGHEAFALVKETKFDCIILDLTLPDMTGFEWLEAIEKQQGEASLPPIIVYTAKELTEEENLRLSRFASGIVIKGVNSPMRLLDEVTLFLHSVESTLPKDQQAIIRMQHNPDMMLKGKTVLLVDDDLRNTFALSKPLRKCGLNVIVADNGQMALEKLNEEKTIDMIVMDIMMPVMDGYRAMREIRALQRWKDIPILALTARAMPEEQAKCIEAGANDYLTKPVDVDRLLTLMRVWLFKQELAA